MEIALIRRPHHSHAILPSAGSPAVAFGVAASVDAFASCSASRRSSGLACFPWSLRNAMLCCSAGGAGALSVEDLAPVSNAISLPGCRGGNGGPAIGTGYVPLVLPLRIVLGSTCRLISSIGATCNVPSTPGTSPFQDFHSAVIRRLRTFWPSLSNQILLHSSFWKTAFHSAGVPSVHPLALTPPANITCLSHSAGLPSRGVPPPLGL